MQMFNPEAAWFATPGIAAGGAANYWRAPGFGG